jgi:integrase
MSEWILKGGVSLATAQKLCRHSDPRITSKIYGHLDTDDVYGAWHRSRRAPRWPSRSR